MLGKPFLSTCFDAGGGNEAGEKEGKQKHYNPKQMKGTDRKNDT